MAYGGGSGFTKPNLNDGELWLPSGFLGDVAETKMMEQKNCVSVQQQLPCEWGTTLGDSAAGLSETDEEDDYMAGLAQRVAYAMLDDDDDDENCERDVGFRGGAKCVQKQRDFAHQVSAKGYGLSRSPQSTLTGLEKWSAENDIIAKENAWALLNMAAEQVVRLEQGRRNGAYEMPRKTLQGAEFQSQGQLNRSAFVARKGFPTTEIYSADPAYHVSPQMLPQRASNPRLYAEVAKGCAQNRSASNARPLNRQNMSPAPGHMGGASGMRAVFLGSNGPGRESGGTGFFLPRRMDNKGYTAKTQPKPACSTVLLPARIVEALNLNVEDLRSSPYVYVRKNEKRRYVEADSWQQQQQQRQRAAGYNPGCYESQPPSDIALPKEWSY